MSSYFYIIEHISSKTKYAGCCFAKDADHSTFLTDGGYTTSSAVVNNLIKQEGIQAFKIVQLLPEEVLGVHAYWYETNFLRTYNIASRHDWFNMHNNERYPFGSQEFKNIMLKKYGVEHSMQNPSSKQKAITANIEKYGVDCVFKSEVIKQQIKDTHLKELGVEYASQTTEFRSKVTATCNEKYGVNNVSQSAKIKEKKVSTCLTNFGVEYPMQSAIVKEKSKETSITKYGVSHPTKSDTVKRKQQTTMLTRYGVDNWAKTDAGKKATSDRMTGHNNPRFGKAGTFLNRTHSEEAKRKSSMTKDQHEYITPYQKFECRYDFISYCDAHSIGFSSMITAMANPDKIASKKSLRSANLDQALYGQTWKELGFIRQTRQPR